MIATVCNGFKRKDSRFADMHHTLFDVINWAGFSKKTPARIANCFHIMTTIAAKVKRVGLKYLFSVRSCIGFSVGLETVKEIVEFEFPDMDSRIESEDSILNTRLTDISSWKTYDHNSRCEKVAEMFPTDVSSELTVWSGYEQIGTMAGCKHSINDMVSVGGKVCLLTHISSFFPEGSRNVMERFRNTSHCQSSVPCNSESEGSGGRLLN